MASPRRRPGYSHARGRRGAGLLARLVLERDRQAYAVALHRAVLDRDVLTDHLRDPQVADALRGGLDRVLRGSCKRVRARPDHLGDPVDAVGHACSSPCLRGPLDSFTWRARAQPGLGHADRHYRYERGMTIRKGLSPV